MRFHRDIEHPVASIAEHDKDDAEAYRALQHKAVPMVKTAVLGLESGSSAGGSCLPDVALSRSAWTLADGPARPRTR